MFTIHPTADVQSQSVGKGKSIWQFVVILPDAQIDEDCNINCHCFVENNVKIGNNVTLKSGVFLWNGISIEDNVFIGPSVAFINDLFPRSKQYVRAKETTVCHGASIGANSTILGGIRIGKYALIGAASNVTKNVPDHALVYGNPAVIKGWVDEYGNRLKQVDEKTWKSIDGRLFEMYCNGLKLM